MCGQADGSITFFNHRWFEYTGLSLEQSLSGGWNLLIHPEDAKGYLDEWARAVATGDSFEYKFRLKRAVGVKAQNGYRSHLCRAVAVHDANDAVIEWFGTWTDIQGDS